MEPVQIHRRKTLASEYLLEAAQHIDLTIGNRTIRSVRGYSPYHILIPELQVVYCVVDGPGHKSIVHFVRLSDSKDIAIQVSATDLGYDIGGTGERREIVDNLDGQTVTIARCYGDMKSTFSFDLARGVLINEAILPIVVGKGH